jgi:hypothetical protein
VRDGRNATMVTGGPLARPPNACGLSHGQADAGRRSAWIACRDPHEGHFERHQQRPDAASSEPGRPSLNLEIVIQSSKRPAAVVGQRSNGKSRPSGAGRLSGRQSCLGRTAE